MYLRKLILNTRMIDQFWHYDSSIHLSRAGFMCLWIRFGGSFYKVRRISWPVERQLDKSYQRKECAS
jgi:hypothetical protein